ncbi:ORF1L [Planaria asexual strain-specific virus-like element type 1]|uniref:ORF1L n=1 Tax=Planaria asexual strain-specific virus-like element type 1 TaxID=159252 RepID=UPI00000F2C48|nr:ORF1L [Planaria asexual strain-specific virus-like element type 1]AAK53628.1 ORF1L [Planaria asexual strain-specific virus-like element type 1]
MKLLPLRIVGTFVWACRRMMFGVNLPWGMVLSPRLREYAGFFNILHNFVCYRPLSCKFRLYNLQTTGQVGTNDFAGAPRATEILTFTDTIGVTGRGLVQPPHLQKAFTELYEDNSFMTRAFNGGGAKKWDTFLNEKLHGSLSTDFIPYEGSPNINVVPTNVGQDIAWNFDMPNDSVPRSTVEFFVQKNKSSSDKGQEQQILRFDNTHHKIFSSNDVHANMGSLLGTRFVEGGKSYTFPMSKECETIQFEHMVRYIYYVYFYRAH